MSRNAAQLDHSVKQQTEQSATRPGPRIVQLERLEQPFTSATNYRIELPKREPWTAEFEFFTDDE